MGHPYRFTGVYKTSKHDARFHLYRLRQSIGVGWTSFSEREIDRIVHDLQASYLGCDYHTVTKTSIDFAKSLVGQLSNEPQSKSVGAVKVVQFPSRKI